MKGSDDLFELIKSLSKSEKRYFKLSSALQSGDKNYLLLFDVIDKQTRLKNGQEEYNEQVVKSKLKNTSFIKTLSLQKQRLYNSIKRSLRNYHEKSHGDIQLKNLIHDVKILHQKGLLKQCKKTLQQAKKLAHKYDNMPVLIEINEWKRRVWVHQSLHEKASYDITKHIGEQQQFIEQYANICEYNNLSLSYSGLAFERAYARSKHDLIKLEKIIRHPLLANMEKAQTNRAKILFLSIHATHSRFMDDLKNACKYNKEITELMELHQMVNENLNIYVSALVKYVQALIESKEYNDCFKVMKKLTKTLETYPGIMPAYEFMAFTFEAWLYCMTGLFEQGVKLINKFDEKIKPIIAKTKNQNEFALYFHFTCIYFGAKNYKKALYWTNYITNHNEKEVRGDILSFTKLLTLIIHFELNNLELIEYLVKSTYRFLYKRNHLFKFETIVLHFIRNKLPKADDQKQLVGAFTILRNELLEVMKDPYEKKVLNYFDFISWLDSKIENRSFAEVVKSKVK